MITVSLHIYRKHINHTGPSQFNLEKRMEMPFIVKVDYYDICEQRRERVDIMRAQSSRELLNRDCGQPSYTP